MIPMRPVIGITCDVEGEACKLRRTYLTAIQQAGGTPLIIPPCPDHIEHYHSICDGFVISGGDDPIMEVFGKVTHPQATKVDPQRQQSELLLLNLLRKSPDVPMLGVCWGMQLMALHEGGEINQFLQDTLPTWQDHYPQTTHDITGPLGTGKIMSNHRQAISDPGQLEVVAHASDGVIEAVQDPDRKFFLGVQWHPERCEDPHLGLGLFQQLITAART